MDRRRIRLGMTALLIGSISGLPMVTAADPLATCFLLREVSPVPLETPPPDEVHADIATASYVLSLGWSPEYCRSHELGAGAEIQCRSNRFGFIVHGLWPNGPRKVHPRFCRSVPALDVATLKANLCMTPSARLLQHEWQAHGSCGWGAADAYFARARALREALNVPDLGSGPDAVMTAGKIRDAFVDVNKRLPRRAIDVQVGEHGRLEEVRVCYDLKFRWSPCAAGSGAADDVTIVVTHKP
jgi:ribonuclease T2